MTDAKSERRKWWSLHVRALQTGITFEKGSKRLFSPVATHLLDGRVPRIGVAWKKACVSKE